MLYHPTAQTAWVKSKNRNKAVPVGRSGAVQRQGTSTANWWLWPHLYSLDAPLVAVVWQAWWAREAGVSLSWHKGVILALSTWLIYLADRLADTFGQASERQETARHVFTNNHRRTVTVSVTALLGTLALVTPLWLNRDEFLTGLGLLGLALGYFWMTHVWKGRPWAAVFPKEAAVGSLFAFGSVAFILCRSRHVTGELLAGVLSFAFLCFLNCALITRWEGTERDRADATSLFNAYPEVLRHLPLASLTTALLAFTCSILTRTEIFLPLAASAALLTWLDHVRFQLSANVLRTLADVVLLVPLCFLLLPPT